MSDDPWWNGHVDLDRHGHWTVSPTNPVLRFRAAAVELNFHATAISGVKPSSATRLVISSR